MGGKRMLIAYLKMLEDAREDTAIAIRELLAIQEKLHVEGAEESKMEDINDEMQDEEGLLEISMVTKPKNEVMVMSKINPALTVEVKTPRKKLDNPNWSWLIQCVCAEHQTEWELAACTDGKKRGRTEFTTDLLMPLKLADSAARQGWCAETLPGILLNHEHGVKDEGARNCYMSGHRFQLCVCIVDSSMEAVSSLVATSSFLMTPYTTGTAAADDYICGQAQKARKITKHIREKEIHERVQTTKIFCLEERKHIHPKIAVVRSDTINIATIDSEFAKVEITGQNFHRPNVVRIDAEYDDLDVLKQSLCSSTTCVGASVKVPRTPVSWMLKVRNFDDPNLDSDDYLYLNFIYEEPMSMTDSFGNMQDDDFGGLTPLFLLDAGELSLPSPAISFDPIKTEDKADEILQRYKQNCKLRLSPVPSANAFVDRSLFYYHIMNGYTHTVASMLNSIESNKHGLKMKFGAVPAMLALLSENPCTVILCLALYYFEQRELSQAEFKKLLMYILFYERAIPLHPHMLLDFLENDIGIDARVRFMKATIIFAENFLAGDDSSMSGDDYSPYQSEDDECLSTSDEDYEEPPPQKILKSTAGSGLKICIKIEQPNKQGGFRPVALSPQLPSATPRESPTSLDSKDPKGPCECEWDHCLVCERDIPIMLQTQNPTWAAIMRVVFFSFTQIFPNDVYWKVRQAYKYIEDHWEKLCPGKSQAGGGWRKQLQDALSHNKQYFISGMHIYNQKGYWGLKQTIDPWAITDEDDYPKRAYHHQPRRGRPPKGSNKKKFSSKLKKGSKKFYD